MKKKLLTILFPVILTLLCAFGVWAIEPSAAKPCCDKSAQTAPAKTAGCENCAKRDKAAAGCECAKCDKAAGCECAKCDNAAGCQCAKCDKAAAGCANCPKKQSAEAKPCGGAGCDKCAKMQQAESKPCCDKSKAN